MTTTEYLEQLFDTESKRNIYIAEAERWHEMASSISVSYDKEPVKSSGNKQKLETATVNAVYYEKKAREQMAELMKQRDRIVNQIVELADRESRDILYLYYVKEKHISQICSDIGYSDSQTRRKYRKAIEVFEKCYGNEYLKANDTK